MNPLSNSPLSLIKDLLKDLNSDWEERLRDINAYLEFEPIYKLKYKEAEKNLIVAFIILAYDYQSAQIDVRRDRSDDKSRILKNIGFDPTKELFKKIVSGEENTVKECGFNYCMSRKNWKFTSVLQLIEQSSESMRYAREKTDAQIMEEQMSKDGNNKITLTTDLDPEKVAKVKLIKMNILDKANEDRRKADDLIEEIKKEYAPIEKAIEEEYNFLITDSSTFNIECWADYIRKRNSAKEKQLTLRDL